jgi:hypothetical protein
VLPHDSEVLAELTWAIHHFDILLDRGVRLVLRVVRKVLKVAIAVWIPTHSLLVIHVVLPLVLSIEDELIHVNRLVLMGTIDRVNWVVVVRVVQHLTRSNG